MSSLSINDFLPVYPSIYKEKDMLFDLFPSGFAQSLYSKKEFNNLKPDLERPRINDGKFYPQAQQIYAHQYASYNSPYDNQIIIHSMGLGKTALAVLTAEENIKRGFAGAVIAVPNKKFIMTFINEILNITGLKYYPPNYEQLTKEELDRALKSSIKKYYKFITFESFANHINKNNVLANYIQYIDQVKNQTEDLKNEDFVYLKNLKTRIDNEYSNRVIIVDEAHNLRTQPNVRIEKSYINLAFHLFLHSVKNCKILLLTATPMKDRWNEISDLMNLILPLNSQLPNNEEFDKVYNNDGQQIQNENMLRNIFRGKISTLRTIPSTVKREFVGNLIQGLKIFKIDTCEMSQFQSAAYFEAFKKDTGKDADKNVTDDDLSNEDIEDENIEINKKGIYNYSQQAINFVFPDGTYGDTGFKAWTSSQPAKIMLGAESKFPIPQLTPQMKSHIRKHGDSDETALKNLYKYSAKYAVAIQNILLQYQRKGGNTFIYNTLVNGSGLIIFARILELFGYTRSIEGVENTKGKRYFLLTNQTIDVNGTITSNIQKTVNDPKNATGEYIQVILGSRTSGEGFSFYNVEDIGIMTPFWNYSPIDQAIGRGIRYRSHEEIEKIYANRGQEFSVKVHHYAGIPITNKEYSIDMIMYKYSEDKDIKIKRGERFLKEISYDCGNNQLINMKGIDNSRECEYLECNYKCDGITDLDIPEEKLDDSTYNKYYFHKELNEIIEKIKTIFKTNFFMTYKDIKYMLSEHTDFMILKTLKTMIDQSIDIYNKYGYKSYLREQFNVYFIVNSMETPSSFLSVYYSINPSIKIENPFQVYTNKLLYEYSLRFSRKLCELIQGERYNDALEYWTKLPLDSKEDFIREIIDQEIYDEENKNIIDEKSQKFRRWILDLNKVYIYKLNDGKILISFPKNDYIYVRDSNEWNKVRDPELFEEIEKIRNVLISSVRNNKFGYYGKLNQTLFKGGEEDGWKAGFWIVETEKAEKGNVKADKRHVITGEKCSTGTLNVAKLATIAFKFGLTGEYNKNDSLDKINKFIASKKIEMDLANFSETDRRRLYNLLQSKAKYLCTKIYEFMRDNNILEITDQESMKITN